jgi:hypothetical protein
MFGNSCDLPNLQNAPTRLDPDFDASHARFGAECELGVSNLSPHFPHSGELWGSDVRKPHRGTARRGERWTPRLWPRCRNAGTVDVWL